MARGKKSHMIPIIEGLLQERVQIMGLLLIRCTAMDDQIVITNSANRFRRTNPESECDR